MLFCELKADIPVPEKLIEIVDFQVYNQDTVQLGDTIPITLNFRAKFDCDVKVSIPMFGGVTILNDTNRNYIYSQNLSVEKDSLNSMIIYLKVSDSMSSVVSGAVGIIPDDSYVTFPMGFTGFDIAPNKYIDIGPFDNCNEFEENIDYLCKTYSFTQLVANSNPTNGTLRRRVMVNGSILFHDHYEPHLPEPAKEKGALTNVWLYFYKNNAPYILYHPVPLNNGKPREGIHYKRCNEQGGFSFDFTYLLDSLISNDPLANWQIAMFVAKENEAIKLHSTSNHSKINFVNNPDRSSNDLKVFIIKLQPPSNNKFTKSNDYTWGLGKVYFNQLHSTDEEGAIFRHTTLARKFLIERLELDPENQSQIEANIPGQIQITERYHPHESNGYASGQIYVVHRNLQNRTRPTSNLMSHEWSHYYHSFLGFKGVDIIKEGWAVFFANAFMNWEEKKYGDTRDYIDDCEMGPYFDYLASFEFGEEQYGKDHNIRFGNISKTNFKFNNIPVGHDMSRFACYLWNIYDSYQEGNYKRPAYEGYENDDVHGLGKDVFDCFKYYNQNYESLTVADKSLPKGFNEVFKTYSAGSNNELQASIQKIYDCMEFGKGLDLYNNTVKMPPPPVEIVTFHQEGQLSYVDVKTTTYPESIGYLNKRWETLTGDTLYHITANFSNIEDGVQVQFYAEDEWKNKIKVLSYYDPYRAYLDRPEPTKYKIITYSRIWDKNVTPPGPYDFFSYGEKPEFEVFKIGVNNSSDISFDELIYPNPNKGTLNIKSPRLTDGILTINVYDISGEKIYSATRRAFGNELNIHLPSNNTNGIYYFEVIDTKYNTTLVKNSFIINK